MALVCLSKFFGKQSPRTYKHNVLLRGAKLTLTEAGNILRTSTPPTLNHLLLPCASISAATLDLCQALISFRMLVLNDPPARRRL
jgi:hypothetical protein